MLKYSPSLLYINIRGNPQWQSSSVKTMSWGFHEGGDFHGTVSPIVPLAVCSDACPGDRPRVEVEARSVRTALREHPPPRAAPPPPPPARAAGTAPFIRAQSSWRVSASFRAVTTSISACSPPRGGTVTHVASQASEIENPLRCSVVKYVLINSAVCQTTVAPFYLSLLRFVNCHNRSHREMPPASRSMENTLQTCQVRLS